MPAAPGPCWAQTADGGVYLPFWPGWSRHTVLVSTPRWQLRASTAHPLPKCLGWKTCLNGSSTFPVSTESSLAGSWTENRDSPRHGPCTHVPEIGLCVQTTVRQHPLCCPYGLRLSALHATRGGCIPPPCSCVRPISSRLLLVWRIHLRTCGRHKVCTNSVAPSSDCLCPHAPTNALSP
jgi:hypothetical protein